MTNVDNQKQGIRKERGGIVLSDKMQKTIVVQIIRRVQHPLYKKVINKYAKFKVHDEKNAAKTGDTVRIVETRPLSKEKHWRLMEIVSRGKEKLPDVADPSSLAPSHEKAPKNLNNQNPQGEKKELSHD